MNLKVREILKNQFSTDYRVNTLFQRKSSFVFFVGVLAIICFFASTEALAVNRTWDGEGATNNFNEAANWSGNTVPGMADIAVFDGTSTKDCTINVSVNLSGININAGYLGTITQGSSNVTLSGAFTQTTGTFTGGSGLLDFNGNVTISGGTFNAPSGDLNLSSNLTISGTGVFNTGTGTVVFDGASQTIVEVVGVQNFNNLTINKTGGNQVAISNSVTLRVNGALTLTDGPVNANGGSPVLEATGSVTFAPTFDGGTINLLISGTATRTVTLPVGIVVPRLTINAANVTVNTSGTGSITFAQPIVIQSAASFSNGAVNFIFSQPFTFGGSANFALGSGNLTFNGTFTQTGGTFTPGSGLLDFNSSVTISGGTFNAPNGDLNLSFNLTISGTGIFNAGTGTVVFDGGSQTIVDVVSVQDFNNLTVNKTGGNQFVIQGGDTIRVNGLLSLTDGQVNPNGAGAVLEATGGVTFASTFDGGTINFRLSGASVQTYTYGGGINTTGTWTVDKSAGTVNLGSDLNLSNGSTSGIFLTNGTITTGNFIVIAGSRVITRTNGFVNGNLRRTYTAAGSQTFDVGTSNGHAPATITAVDGTFGTTNFTVGSKPGFLDGSNANKSLSRHWSLAASAGGITAVNIRFDYRDTDVPPTANEADFTFLRRVNGMTTTQNISTLDTTQNFGVLNGHGIITSSEWTLGVQPPTAASVTVGGRVVTGSGRGVSRAMVTMTDANGNVSYAVTNPFGYYRFADVAAGQSVIISVRHKQYEFANPSRVVFVGEEIGSIDFTGFNRVTTKGVRDIGGVITDSKGVRLPKVAVELSGGDLKTPVAVVTNEAGGYHFSDIPVGAGYVLRINGKNLQFTPQAIFLTEETGEVNIKAKP